MRAPDLANVVYPTLDRLDLVRAGARAHRRPDRRPGPADDRASRIDFNAFYSHLKATNYNRNWMFWGSHVFIGGDRRDPDVVHGDQRDASRPPYLPNLGSLRQQRTSTRSSTTSFVPARTAETAYY